MSIEPLRALCAHVRVPLSNRRSAFGWRHALLVGAVLCLSGAVTPPAADPDSDRVGATRGSFAVDAAGAATYSMPIFVTPGVAGLAPRLSLDYSSQGGDGPLGRGWSIGGMSSIARCRAAPETGDVDAAGMPQSGQIRLDGSDKFCLDGQRLLASTDACPSLANATAVAYRTEIDTYQRVCAYSFNVAKGPRFFTVEAKDGTRRWYGDRRETAGGESVAPTLHFGEDQLDGAVEFINTSTVEPGNSGRFLSWAQTRIQDATGNYIDYSYDVVNGYQNLMKVYYTGKAAVPGSGVVREPFAWVSFSYQSLPVPQQSASKLGVLLRRADDQGNFWATMEVQRLSSVGAIDVFDTFQPVRHYALGYNTPTTVKPGYNLTSLQECADYTKAICYPATTFQWTGTEYRFSPMASEQTVEFGQKSRFEGYKLGDVDGDGLQDIVRLEDDGDGCSTEYVHVEFARLDAMGEPYYPKATQKRLCSPYELSSLGEEDSWFLFDYDGDGRDDLMMATDTGWVLYASHGRPASDQVQVFDTSDNLILGLVPGTTTYRRLAQLGDFNGDGLLDVIYPDPDSAKAGTYWVRLMARDDTGGFSWEATPWQIETTIPCDVGNTCKLSTPKVVKGNGGYQLYDFDGDARSDLVFRNERICNGSCDTFYIQVFGVEYFRVEAGMKKASLVWKRQWQESQPDYKYMHGLALADINGDGLTDRVYQKGGEYGNWYYSLGTGTAVDSETVLQYYSAGTAMVGVTDLNGDRRADLVFGKSGSVDLTVQYGAGLGSPSGPTDIETSPAFHMAWCTGDCLKNQSFIFGDFDGDASVDALRLQWENSTSKMQIFRADPGARFKPRDHVVSITDGLGARTEIDYLPMSLNGVYRSDYTGRTRVWGRGSPVLDVRAPMYVVGAVRTDAPTAESAAARRTVAYRYAGAKMQAGGRGFLGFREVTSFDNGHSDWHLATTTTYRQDFPYVGKPLSTSVRVVGGDYLPGPCGSLATAHTADCFTYDQTGSFPAVGGIEASRSDYGWDSNFAPTTASPVRVALEGTFETRFDPERVQPVVLARVDSVFDHDDFGNLTSASVVTSTGASDPAPARKVTTNTFAAPLVDSLHWRVGQLVASSVAYTRGLVTVTRNTAFGYDANTGLLVKEHVQPGGHVSEDLRTEYTLDAYGNRTNAYTCSNYFKEFQQTEECRTKAPIVSVWDSLNRVHRFRTTFYDPNGRFETMNWEPMRTTATNWGTGQRTNTLVLQVHSRDRFGNVTEASGVNGTGTAAAYGAMGRPFWTWTRTVDGAAASETTGGISSFQTYRRCGTTGQDVSCPAGAAFREKVTVSGASRQWTYFDRLGRSVMAVKETLNEGVSGKDVSATCTWYDGTGRVAAVSNPFFLPGVVGLGDPQVGAATCSVTDLERAVGVTHSSYDALGRPTKTEVTYLPIGQPERRLETNLDYNGLAVTTTNAALQKRTEVKNGLGELVSSTDNLGLVTSYAYDPVGNLTRVSQKPYASRAAVITSITYDEMGRKTLLTDPDSGTHTYAYNAAGEVVAEQDALNYIAKRYDFKGRLIWEGEKAVGGAAYERSTYRTYDTASNGLGQLAVVSTDGAYDEWKTDETRDVDHTVINYYEPLGRLRQSTTMIPLMYGDLNAEITPFVQVFQYDGLGRAYKHLDASGNWAKTEFSPRGFAVRTCESDSPDKSVGCIAASGLTYTETSATDARGAVVEERRGGNARLVTRRTYDPLTGTALSICTGDSVAGTCTIVDDKYAWDNAGNLLSRQRVGYTELFEYDELNRLGASRFSKIGATVFNDPATRPYGAQLKYDLLGNLCSKLTPSTGTPTTRTYNYGGAAGCGPDNGLPGSGGASTSPGPHAVTSTSVGAQVETNYSYDATGNQTTADRSASNTSDRTVYYNRGGDAYDIVRGTRGARFWYDADGGRYQRDDVTATATTRTVIVGNVEISFDLTTPDNKTTRRYLDGALYRQYSSSGTSTLYLHHDHLGSIVAVTGPATNSATGTVMERLDYSPSGERRNATDPRLAGGGAALSKRGFTGHETIDLTDVIHMNGRIYDPALGRFLQVDPVIQDPANGQNYNRYTYVWNNPLAYTDPTGMISVKNLVRQVVGIYVSAYLGNSTNVFGNMAGGSFANSTSGLVGSYVAGGKNNIGLSASFTTSMRNSDFSLASDVEKVSEDREGSDTESQRLASGDFRFRPKSAVLRGRTWYLKESTTQVAVDRANAAVQDLLNSSFDASEQGLEALAMKLADRLQPFQRAYYIEFAVRIFRSGDRLFLGSVSATGSICYQDATCDSEPAQSMTPWGLSSKDIYAYFHTHPSVHRLTPNTYLPFSDHDIGVAWNNPEYKRAFVSQADNSVFKWSRESLRVEQIR